MISIQKQVVLLSDFHYKEFLSYLENTNADLPFKLISTIRKQKIQPSSDELCTLVYGDSQEKTRKKFLQLTHHTFKLSSYLSRNYPNYLKHNVVLIEELLSKGEKAKANEIADWLIDVADKIEDYTTLIEVYKFVAQQAFISESKDAIKFHKKIEHYIELEGIKNSIYSYLREHAFFKGKESVSKAQLNKDLAFFDKYIKHESHSINILARFGKFYELSFLNHPNFFKADVLKKLDDTERDFLNNAHICFHYLDDFYFKILGLRLQHLLGTTDASGALTQEIKKMNNNSSFLKYWKSYINVPELFSFALQTTLYVSKYGKIYRADYHSKLPVDVKSEIAFLIKKMDTILQQNIWDDGHIIKLINVKCFHAAMLLTGDAKDRQKSIKTIEDTLVSYQQIPFQKFLDGMFATLLMGYFSLKQYDKVITSYKRYKKITADQIVIKENEVTIETYYYCAQYLTNARKQYIEKLESAYASSKQMVHISDLIEDITTYFKIPVTLK